MQLPIASENSHRPLALRFDESQNVCVYLLISFSNLADIWPSIDPKTSMKDATSM